MNSRANKPYITVVKKTDETRDTTTTIATDAELVATLPPGTYIAIYDIDISSGTTPDYKYDIFFTGTTTAGGYPITDPSPITPATLVALGTDVVLATDSNNQMLHIVCRLIVTVTGILQFRWAQNTSDGGNTVTISGSLLRIWKT